MARTIAEIQAAIIVDKNSRSDLDDLDSPSNVAIWLTWTYIVAVAIQLHEQIFDLFKTDTQTIADAAIPGTLNWWAREIGEFQYSVTNPQNIVLIDLVPTYPTVDESLQILTRVSISETPNLVVNIKVAKEEPPVTLDGLEQASLEDYIDTIKPAGVKTNLINADADRLRIEAIIYHDGAFSSTIQADTFAALENYMATLPFDGVVRLVDLVDSLQQVSGFIDIDRISIKARTATTLLVNANEVDRRYDTFSGRIIEEDTAGNSFSDTITFSVE